MSLLDNARKEAQVEAPTPAAEGTPSAKKHNNSEYQKRQREHQFKAACAIRDFIKAQGITLPEDLQAEMDFLTKERKAAGSTFGKPVLYKIFGNTPKKGDSVEALKIFKETGKGFAEMRSLMKRWAEKQNVTVKYDVEKKAYIVDSDVPAYVEA